MPINKKPVTATNKEPVKVPAKLGQPKNIQWELIQPNHTLNDLILDDRTHGQILDIISYFKNRELLFTSWGLEERFATHDNLAVNLYGPPGTGKTVAAHAISSALCLQMICVDYAEIESKYVGETAKNLNSLFQTACEQGALIFFDEADALLSKRVTNMTSATDVSVNQTRSVLLNLLNSYQGVILFATNFIQNFDVAFLRRIKYHIQFYLPDAELREKLWRMYIPAKMPCEVDCTALAQKYSGISGSDIANAVFSAAVRTARDREGVVLQKRFEDAIQSCLNVKNANSGENIKITKRILNDTEVEKLNLLEEVE